MTEKDWQSCEEPEPMLDFLSRRRKSHTATQRELTLFACACCRRIWPFVPTEACRKAVEVGERYVDQLATEDERFTAWSSAFASAVEVGIRLDDPYEMESIEWGYVPGGCAVLATLGLVGRGDVSPRQVAWAARAELALEASGTGNQVEEAYRRIELIEQKVQAILLRHIIGNPYHPYPAPAQCPSIIVDLAEALYAGENCSFALRDALLEAGHSDLAEHFRDNEHPKGCWAIDLISGRK